MQHARFWAIIDEAGGSTSALTEILQRLPVTDLAAFDAWFYAYYQAVHREDLWAAVSAICGGCSDDSFDYFCGWLIGRGEAALLAAVRDPESLAELISDRYPYDEHMLGAAKGAHDGELPASPEVSIPDMSDWPEDRIAWGERWTDELYAKQFPKLYAHYIVSRPTPPPAGSIPLDMFWSILASAVTGSSDATDADARLDAHLRTLSREQFNGFERWFFAYDGALRRDDVRLLCRELLGADDLETLSGFRSWLIKQGERAVWAMTHEPATVRACATHPPAPRRTLLFITAPLREHFGIKNVGPSERIPDLDTWRADVMDVDALSPSDRHRVARDLLGRASVLPFDRRLPLLDQALQHAPDDDEIRSARGQTYRELGRLDDALRELDGVLERRPDFVASWWERSQVHASRGDRTQAVADARAVADRVPEAREWLATLVSNPKRVRHPKFGEGIVVSIDSSGAEPTLVIDFAVGRKKIASRFVDMIE